MNMLKILKEISLNNIKNNTIFIPIDHNEQEIIYQYGTLYWYYNKLDENEYKEIKVEELIMLITDNVKYQ